MPFACVFPGQGSQSLGMQAALAERWPVVRDTYAEASDVLGYDLWKRVQEGPEEELNRTVVTQPAMLTAGVATWRCWQAADGPVPARVAGHSLGEYTALVAARSIGFADALAVVARRAELMQEAVPPDRGAMAAILGLEDEFVTRACDEAAGGQIVVPVNFNAPGQVVIAGEREAVERAVVKAKEAGAKRAMMLRVSVPSHSPLMEPAAEGLVEHLDGIGIRKPEIPVLDAVAVAPYEDPARIRTGLKNQVHNPVRWTDTVLKLREDGIDLFVECGPGKVLAGLVRRIDRDAVAIAVDNPESLDRALAAARDND